MATAILIKSLRFKFTVEEKKTLNHLEGYLENNCILTVTYTKQTDVSDKCGTESNDILRIKKLLSVIKNHNVLCFYNKNKLLFAKIFGFSSMANS
jgi:hypothetical protein